jgi:sugar lactone lactonase YvrE
MLHDIMVPNCLAWSPDDQFMYFAESRRQRITRFPYDLDGGTIGTGALFVDTATHPGIPDGGTMEAEVCLWNAE